MIWSCSFTPGPGCPRVNHTELLAHARWGYPGAGQDLGHFGASTAQPQPGTPAHVVAGWVANVNGKRISQKLGSFALWKVTPKVRTAHPSNYLSIGIMGEGTEEWWAFGQDKSFGLGKINNVSKKKMGAWTHKMCSMDKWRKMSYIPKRLEELI